MTSGLRMGTTLALVVALAACDAPPQPRETYDEGLETAPAADQGEDAATGPAPEAAPPAPDDTPPVPPPSPPDANDSVQPESDTLFY